jgi:malonyl-CoA O-methyltransferase
MPALSAREGYRLWAPSYSPETAISHLEAGLVAAMTPTLDGLHLLDAGCGTGRRLRSTGAASAVGVDLSPEMLDAGIGRGTAMPGVRTLVGDVRALPLPDQSFDLIWCRLVLGHLPEIGRAYAELGRVAAAGALVIVSDFHPAAHAAGHRRTFREAGQVHEVEHHVHTVAAHLEAARSAGLTPVDFTEAPIGPEIRDFYDRAGRAPLYHEHLGLPVVLALSFRREG